MPGGLHQYGRSARGRAAGAVAPGESRALPRASGARSAPRCRAHRIAGGAQAAGAGAGQRHSMTKARRIAIFERLRAANPQPVSELRYGSPFELLVAVMLSAQTTDRSVNAATAKLFPVANTPQTLLALGVAGVKPYLQTIGLHNAKAANLMGLCRRLIDLHQGQV